MTQVTFNGHEYSDDGSAARDMQGGGVTWVSGGFPPSAGATGPNVMRP